MSDEPVVTEQEIDSMMANPLQRVWMVHGWHMARRASQFAAWMTGGGDKVAPEGGVKIVVNQFNDGADDPDPTEAELRAYALGRVLAAREEVAEEEAAERREKDGRKALIEARALLGRTT